MIDTLATTATTPASIHVAWIVAWLVVVSVLFIALLVLAISHWGRSQPMRICVVLSLLAHVLLAGYAATVRIAAVRAAGEQGAIEVTFGEHLFDDRDAEQAAPPRPWDAFPSPPPKPSVAAPLQRQEPPESPAGEPEAVPAADQQFAARPASGAQAVVSEISHTPTRRPPPIDVPTPDAAEPPATAVAAAAAPQRMHELPRNDPPPDDESAVVPRPAPPSLPTEMPLVTTPQPLPAERPATEFADDADVTGEVSSATAGASDSDHSPTAAPLVDLPDGRAATSPADAVAGHEPGDGRDQPSAGQAPHVPEVYRLRTAPNRREIAGRLGGNARTEASVEAGLRWLAAAQARDGRWEARRWGGGSAAAAGGDPRRDQAGASADTGVTGLALLAFLGAGHTHVKPGPYRATVQHGLEFLLARQRTNGSLAGGAQLFAAMYCHGMAAFAISEAYAMTHDDRLRSSVVQAVNYTLAAQHPTTGGWRYQPGDDGDTSQLGWQVMALRSAELAGVSVPSHVGTRAARFLGRVSQGRHGGLAGYRPGHRASPAMTAEALACRQFLGLARHRSLVGEATDFIVEQLPGGERARGEPMNLYFWYYATLALYQQQGNAWEQWNEAMQSALLASQVAGGDLAGSWNPNTVWGRHGGRVYTTAMATLCLEVYYRYLPILGGDEN